MPRFYFHVRDGVDRPDAVGTVLPEMPAARAEALVLAGRIIGMPGRGAASARNGSSRWQTRRA